MKTEIKFFTFRQTLNKKNYVVWVYRGEKGTFINGTDSFDLCPSIHLLHEIMHDQTFIEISFDNFKKRYKNATQIHEMFSDVYKHFEKLKPEVKAKPKAKLTVFGIKPFKGTVTINKSIGGPILAAYREDRGKTKPFDKMSFPYHLAVYLRLMPDSSGLQFTNRFYEFSNEEVDDLVATGSEITSVKRSQNGVIVSLNIS
jgi:hypothetical protein